ncbi:hypothetical protein ACIBCA_25025 [Kitasatospora sp. NPDC051170]|uniref:hypothetical protein n=1 Tax=Kitasatospora sp. NPDC051170 TaxID=3364056 RepID=UPI00379C2260
MPERSSSPPAPQMPPLVLRGTRAQARLEPLHVVVEQGGAVHRIPVEAVERVEARPGVVEVGLYCGLGALWWAHHPTPGG